MLDKCADACARQAEVEAVHAVEIETKIGHIETFFDLEAEDIENNVITFDKFKGEVTVITNVASYCGKNAIIVAIRLRLGVDFNSMMSH